MDRRPVGHILLIASDTTTRRRWAEALRGPECRVWCEPEEFPEAVPPERLDVVVSQGPLPSDVRQKLHLPPHGDESPQLCPPALVLVGAEGLADARLPAETDPPTLRLACRLLAELVQYRRRQLAQQQICRQLADAALTDPLTGLPNRRAWEQSLAYPPAAVSPGKQVALAIVDLDLFKQVNDRHGYQQGDRVLQAAAAALAQSVRADDFLARLGGDEFVLRLLVPDPAVARTVMERVRRAIRGRLAQENLPQVTASAGVALADASTLCTHEAMLQLFAAADAAMRSAKRAGRNRTMHAGEARPDCTAAMP